MSKIEINHLTKEFTEKNGTFTALSDISFTVNSGEFVSIIGFSGCGKSTLLSLVEGLNTPTEGEILIDGKPVVGTGTDREWYFSSIPSFRG